VVLPYFRTVKPRVSLPGAAAGKHGPHIDGKRQWRFPEQRSYVLLVRVWSSRCGEAYRCLDTDLIPSLCAIFFSRSYAALSLRGFRFATETVFAEDRSRASDSRLVSRFEKIERPMRLHRMRLISSPAAVIAERSN
jgi:hypothetical protein